MLARCCAMVSCIGCDTGLNVEWCSHPRALELSVQFIIFKPFSDIKSRSHILIIAAMNSNMFMVKTPCKSIGK